MTITQKHSGNIHAMKCFLPLTSLIVLLVAGCATSKQHSAYEYRFFHADSSEDVQKQINELAKEGWRVSAFGLGDVNNSRKYVLMERRAKN